MLKAMTNLFSNLVDAGEPDWFTVGEGDEEVVRLRPGVDPRVQKPVAISARDRERNNRIKLARAKALATYGKHSA